MQRFLTSDLHLGHRSMIKWREFPDMRAHDDYIIERLAALPRRAVLWVLGDVSFDISALERLREIPCEKKYLVMGNHDTFQANVYLKYFTDIWGPQKYKKMWLSHHPIHPQELYRVRGNIHGHIHKTGDTVPLELPYFNVNWDFWHRALPFEEIEEAFNGNES